MATFTAGAIAGISEILTFYPLGRFKFTPFESLTRNDRIYTDVVRSPVSSSDLNWLDDVLPGQNSYATRDRQIKKWSSWNVAKHR